MINKEEKKEIILRPITELKSIDYPERPENIKPEEFDVIKDNIDKNAYIIGNEIVLHQKGIPKTLSTDKKGANKFINDLEEDQKIKNENDIYVKLPPIQKELCKRIQEPHDPIKREKNKCNEKILIAVRDASELEHSRDCDHQRISNELPKLKEKKMRAENITKDDITGEPLKPNAVAHHIERKADDPKSALDMTNIAILNPETHIEGHKNNFEGKENYEQFKKNKQAKK
ncbi:MAG: hypothetical protein LBD24_06505 [Spirochaetaceae bacterium]|jgi:hypothetical protein|nr:hypothetical protein [Spirochaetaceae bacterium]